MFSRVCRDGLVLILVVDQDVEALVDQSVFDLRPHLGVRRGGDPLLAHVLTHKGQDETEGSTRRRSSPDGSFNGVIQVNHQNNVKYKNKKFPGEPLGIADVS